MFLAWNFSLAVFVENKVFVDEKIVVVKTYVKRGSSNLLVSPFKVVSCEPLTFRLAVNVCVKFFYIVFMKDRSVGGSLTCLKTAWWSMVSNLAMLIRVISCRGLMGTFLFCFLRGVDVRLSCVSCGENERINDCDDEQLQSRLVVVVVVVVVACHVWVKVMAGHVLSGVVRPVPDCGVAFQLCAWLYHEKGGKPFC